MRTRWLIVLVSLLFVVGQRPAVACSCAQLTKPQLVERASVIFTGVARSASRPFAFSPTCTVSSADPVTFTFDVQTVYKGDVPKTIEVGTAISGASCGYEFRGGETYTVFATSTERRLETNLCGGTVAGTIAPDEYGLGAGRPPRS